MWLKVLGHEDQCLTYEAESRVAAVPIIAERVPGQLDPAVVLTEMRHAQVAIAIPNDGLPEEDGLTLETFAEDFDTHRLNGERILEVQAAVEQFFALQVFVDLIASFHTAILLLPVQVRVEGGEVELHRTCHFELRMEHLLHPVRICRTDGAIDADHHWRGWRKKRLAQLGGEHVAAFCPIPRNVRIDIPWQCLYHRCMEIRHFTGRKGVSVHDGVFLSAC